jgi:serine/threonine protein kinase
MDEVTAKLYEDRSKGTRIEEWEIERLLDSGKSAAVFLGHSKGQEYALKIFDLETVKRYGYEVQQQRLENELLLKAHGIPNLVEILGGGEHERDGVRYFYIVMPFLEGQNLRRFIASTKYDQSFIAKVLTTLLDTSEKLLERQIAHRDIKPDNIMVSTAGEITLMDLGVLKIVGNPSFTDSDEKQFLGTLRYASPEFLFGTEQNTPEGWRSLNIYQIGATLHDLIVKQELFHGVSPYPNVVIAVKEQFPAIESRDVDQRLITLTRNLLNKDWKRRLATCQPDKIRQIVASLSTALSGPEIYYQKAIAIQGEAKSWSDEVAALSSSVREKDGKVLALDKELWQRITDSIGRVRGRLNFKNIVALGHVPLEEPPLERFQIRKNLLYRIEGDIQNSFLREFFLIIKTLIDVDLNCLIGLSAILPGRFINLGLVTPPTTPIPTAWFSLWEQIARELYFGQRPEVVASHRFFFIEVFQGVVAFDKGLSDTLDVGFSRMLAKILDSWRPFVEAEKENQKRNLLTRQGLEPNLSDKTILLPSFEKDDF